MKRTAWAAALVAAPVLFWAAISAHAADKLPKAVAVGKSYDAARITLKGYKPAPNAASRTEFCAFAAEACATYPEVENCAGTGKGQCLMVWTKAGKRLTIVTAFDDPKVIDSITRGP